MDLFTSALAVVSILAKVNRGGAKTGHRKIEMANGYWIPHLDVRNPDGYKAYVVATPPAHHKYTGRALVRGGTFGW